MNPNGRSINFNSWLNNWTPPPPPTGFIFCFVEEISPCLWSAADFENCGCWGSDDVFCFRPWLLLRGCEISLLVGGEERFLLSFCVFRLLSKHLCVVSLVASQVTSWPALFTQLIYNYLFPLPSSVIRTLYTCSINKNVRDDWDLWRWSVWHSNCTW